MIVIIIIIIIAKKFEKFFKYKDLETKESKMRDMKSPTITGALELIKEGVVSILRRYREAV